MFMFSACASVGAGKEVMGSGCCTLGAGARWRSEGQQSWVCSTFAGLMF